MFPFHFLLRLLTLPAVGQINEAINADKSDGEPELTEEALVHAKSSFPNCHIIHFYIAARDTVVNCSVSGHLWKQLEQGSRGYLRHQGGRFISFDPMRDV